MRVCISPKLKSSQLTRWGRAANSDCGSSTLDTPECRTSRGLDLYRNHYKTAHDQIVWTPRCKDYTKARAKGTALHRWRWMVLRAESWGEVWCRIGYWRPIGPSPGTSSRSWGDWPAGRIGKLRIDDPGADSARTPAEMRLNKAHSAKVR